MKVKFLIFSFLLLSLNLFAQTKNLPLPEGQENAEYKFKTNDPMAEMKQYFANNHITKEERTALKLALVKDPRIKKAPIENIIRSKPLYTSTKGKVEVIYFYEYTKSEYGDYFSFHEFFISYNAKGTYIAHLQVGSQMGNSFGIIERSQQYNIKRNVINIEIDSGGESWWDGYAITSLLKFKEVKNTW